MASQCDIELTLTRGSEEFEILARYTIHSWGCPAQTYGPPENCYPGEPIEFEIDDAVISAPPWAKGKYPYDLIPFAITDQELSWVEGRIYDEPPEVPDYDDYDD